MLTEKQIKKFRQDRRNWDVAGWLGWAHALSVRARDALMTEGEKELLAEFDSGQLGTGRLKPEERRVGYSVLDLA